MEELLDILAARQGLVCAVGAGGKKTTLFHIAGCHPGTVGFTATVFTAPPPPSLGAYTLFAEPEEILEGIGVAGANHRLVAFAQPSEKPDRVGGLPPEFIAECHRRGGFDVTLIKADGARMRGIKAPGPGEPVIPEGTHTVLALLSARVLDVPLTEENGHRLERLEAVVGLRRGEVVRPNHFAQLFAAEEGILKGSDGAKAVPIINMVDSPQRLALAREAAQAALELTDRFDRVVLAQMRETEPIVEIVRRT